MNASERAKIRLYGVLDADPVKIKLKIH
jgi:hypothetical protein